MEIDVKVIDDKSYVVYRSCYNVSGDFSSVSEFAHELLELASVYTPGDYVYKIKEK